MPLASLMANGDAGDAITLRIVAAAATVTATRPRGGRSQEGEVLVRTPSFRCLLLCADGFAVVRWEMHVRAVGKGGTGGILAGCITGGCLPPSGSFPLSSSHCPRLTSSLLVNSCSAEISCFNQMNCDRFRSTIACGCQYYHNQSTHNTLGLPSLPPARFLSACSFYIQPHGHRRRLPHDHKRRLHG